VDRPPDLQRVLDELERQAIESERLAEWMNDLEQRIEQLESNEKEYPHGASQ